MEKKIRWGILSTAKIARMKVVPAMQKGSFCEVTAIASRDINRANETAKFLGIPQSYGSYEQLLNDPEIDAVYNPLPNHLHLEWTIKAMEAGKHVLCEKPVGMNTREALKLREAMLQHPHLKVSEAFMYRFHPQWNRVKSIIDDDIIGRVKTIHSFFSYYNIDPENIRNRKEVGGGALMDIGCYCISFARYLFEKEPKKVVSTMNFDTKMGIDQLTTAQMDFTDGQIATFTCSTKLMPYQRVQILGENGHIEIEIPVNAPPDQVTHVWLRTPKKTEEISIPPVDQYTLQCDAFAFAILNNKSIIPSIEDSIGNMKVIDAVRLSAKNKSWVEIE